MKVKIFYSWESDLPQNKNRSLIEECLKTTTKRIWDKNKKITDISIDSDSRECGGTPDLAYEIFNKINECDLFICDVSIINMNSKYRLTPNPNILIELGYAAKSKGWGNILCIFNSEYAKVEDLPFDIRNRKPIVYNTSNNDFKNILTQKLEYEINYIIDNRLMDKNEYIETKSGIDLAIQATLIDLCQLLYVNEKNSEQYNYPRLLNSTLNELNKILSDNIFLGFYLFRNSNVSIKDFSSFINDPIETFFLSDIEKKLIVKFIYALRNYEQMFKGTNVLKYEKKHDEYKVMKGTDINKGNDDHKYILLRPNNGNTFIVLAGGDFTNPNVSTLLSLYSFNPKYIQIISNIIMRIITITNDWERITGKYFIANSRESQQLKY